MVCRAESVVVRGRNEDGDPVTVEADGLLSRAIQHEIDHLEGILFIDRLPPPPPPPPKCPPTRPDPRPPRRPGAGSHDPPGEGGGGTARNPGLSAGEGEAPRLGGADRRRTARPRRPGGGRGDSPPGRPRHPKTDVHKRPPVPSPPVPRGRADQLGDRPGGDDDGRD